MPRGHLQGAGGLLLRGAGAQRAHAPLLVQLQADAAVVARVQHRKGQVLELRLPCTHSGLYRSRSLPDSTAMIVGVDITIIIVIVINVHKRTSIVDAITSIIIVVIFIINFIKIMNRTVI